MPFSKAQSKAHKILLVNANVISKHERVTEEYTWPNRLSLAHVKDFRFQPKIWGAFVVFKIEQLHTLAFIWKVLRKMQKTSKMERV